MIQKTSMIWTGTKMDEPKNPNGPGNSNEPNEYDNLDRNEVLDEPDDPDKHMTWSSPTSLMGTMTRKG